ncbi:heterokaryon incompatibility protein-domain-containing protein [Apiosordaria backusii]|uniref:Heterokaryon incompatibility protein-domain-containing protein n=1 Tax=Apiosordaria backusii TaxID=314023 RepID=A0AA40BLS2_9PEZI|nr:heterokaryon incompatibility protein-domain-containing protein [Apiosordaria backusii]
MSTSPSSPGTSLWDHRLWTFKKSSLDIQPDLPDKLKDIQLEDSEDDDDNEDINNDSELDQNVKSHPNDQWLKYVDAPHSCDLCCKLVIREDRLPSNALGRGGRCIFRLPMSDRKMWKAGKKCPLFRYLCSVFQERRRLRPHRHSAYAAVASDVDMGTNSVPTHSLRKDLFIGIRDGQIKFLYRWPRFRYDDEDLPVGDALLPLPGTPEALNHIRLTSDWAYSRAKTWIQECISKHDSCRLQPSDFVPTRLLDVASIRDNKICLVESKAIPNIKKSARWAALSYVWGGLQPVRTLKDNINSHHKGIPLDELPPTIRHSITVCQSITIPYLWVDCLCIIQDDNDDLGVELQFMAEIYQYSTVTINAASAASVHQGFLQDRPLYFYEDTVQPVQIKFEPLKGSANSGVTGFLLKNNLSYGLEHLDPIHTRAWTYQERKLPMRSIYYSTAGMEWSCRHLVASTVTNTEKLYDDRLLGEGPTVPGQELTPWSVIVQDYTQRNLSFPSDKITAVAAIAAIYEQEQKKTYVAGLWKEDMPECLIWHVMVGEMKPRYEMYTGPSWSWASTDSHVSYQIAHNEEGIVYHTTVLKAESELVMPKAKFAAVKSASLLLQGQVHRATLKVDFETVDTFLDGVSTKQKNVKVTVTAARAYTDKIAVKLDAWEDAWLGESGTANLEVLLLPLFERTRHDPDIGRPGWGGLVIVEVKNGAYRRIGFFIEYFYKRTVGRVSFADFIIGAEVRDLLMV